MPTSNLSLSLTVCLALGVGASAEAEIRYNVIDLGPVISTGDTAKDINELGMAVFCQNTIVGLHHDGVTTVLPGLVANNGGLAINNFGHLAFAQNHRSYFYAAGVKTDLGSLDPVWNNDIYAEDLNDSGVVVGTSRIIGVNAWRAFAWHNGSMSALPAPLGHAYGTGVSSHARAINNIGTVVGSFGTGPQGPHPVMWHEGVGVVLPLPEDYSFGHASDLNQANQAAGYVRGDFNYTRAALWTIDSVMLLGLSPDFLTTSRATALNDLGQVVGVTAYGGEENGLGVLWENGKPTLLNSLIDPDSGWTIWTPLAINNAGMIVGQGVYSAGPGLMEKRSILLTPVPEPTGAMLLAAATLTATLRRRPRSTD